MSIREIFSKLSPIRVMTKHDKSALLQISQVFGTLEKDVLKRAFLEISLTKSLTVRNLGNTLGMTIIFCLKMFKI